MPTNHPSVSSVCRRFVLSVSVFGVAAALFFSVGCNEKTDESTDTTQPAKSATTGKAIVASPSSESAAVSRPIDDHVPLSGDPK